MFIIENEIDKIQNVISDILEDASLDRFCYSGIYTLEFTMKQEQYGFKNCKLDIGVGLKIGKINDGQFFVKDLLLIWSNTVDKVKLDDDLSLTIYFQNGFFCKVLSEQEGIDDLVDMRWNLYQSDDESSFSIWTSDVENIYCKIGLE